MQRIDEYLVAFKDFDYPGYKRPITSIGKCRYVDEMNVAKGLKPYDFTFTSLLLSRTNIGLKTFLHSLWKALVHCNFFELGLSQNYRDVTATINHSVPIFLKNTS